MHSAVKKLLEKRRRVDADWSDTSPSPHMAKRLPSRQPSDRIMEIRYMKYLIKLTSGKDAPIAPVHKLWRAELAILDALVTEQQ